MSHQVEEFFLRYEKANRASSIAEFSTLYAKRFMFAGPNGVQIVELESFLKALPLMEEKYSALGLLDSQVDTVQVHLLDPKYLVARVGWRMQVSSRIGSTSVVASATFVLARGSDNALSIVFQIDHQDLSSVIKNQQEKP